MAKLAKKEWFYLNLEPDKQIFVQIQNISSVEVLTSKATGDSLYLCMVGGQRIRVIGDENFERLTNLLPFIKIERSEKAIGISGDKDFFKETTE